MVDPVVLQLVCYVRKKKLRCGPKTKIQEGQGGCGLMVEQLFKNIHRVPQNLYSFGKNIFYISNIQFV